MPVLPPSPSGLRGFPALPRSCGWWPWARADWSGVLVPASLLLPIHPLLVLPGPSLHFCPSVGAQLQGIVSARQGKTWLLMGCGLLSPRHSPCLTCLTALSLHGSAARSHVPRDSPWPPCSKRGLLVTRSLYAPRNSLSLLPPQFTIVFSELCLFGCSGSLSLHSGFL